MASRGTFRSSDSGNAAGSRCANCRAQLYLRRMSQAERTRAISREGSGARHNSAPGEYHPSETSRLAGREAFYP